MKTEEIMERMNITPPKPQVAAIPLAEAVYRQAEEIARLEEQLRGWVDSHDKEVARSTNLDAEVGRLENLVKELKEQLACADELAETWKRAYISEAQRYDELTGTL